MALTEQWFVCGFSLQYDVWYFEGYIYFGKRDRFLFVSYHKERFGIKTKKKKKDLECL